MTAQKFRKKPVVIEAIQWTGENYREVWDFTGGLWDRVHEEDRPFLDDPEADSLVYDELHSTSVLVYTNDWIIRGIKGELYPCRPDVFAATYEAVEA